MKELLSIHFTIEQSKLVRYAGASGDFNELHTVPQNAIERGHPNVVAHGMYIMGLATNAIKQWFPDLKLTDIKVRFQTAVYPGDKLTIKGHFTKKESNTHGNIEIMDSDGQVKLIGNFEMKD
ncbi:MaoC like domain-containing protein [Psychrobacillus sp. OK028]|uniref:MaoC family dehydratase n=1 Tax=Psychrobacillus sp. OK028 TaxID=1884359 RepID=UPI0008903CCD|nr:MaoC/PaaZ C-terminal domain-containing protein [Psychrobacillus sp. OK028]SDM40369.1 MaoC like domain-containing protein [Psychrobacillus sp. OK028]